MATMSKSFDIALAKGEFGERIVKGILEQKGFVVYKPATPGAHAFDVLAIKDKKRCIALDVKAKSRRNNFPDTGINYKHFLVYRDFSDTHKMPFWLVFVDEMLGKVYGNTIEELSRPREENGNKYPMRWGGDTGIIYWPLSAMIVFHTLTPDECRQLQAMNQRSYDFKPL